MKNAEGVASECENKVAMKSEESKLPRGIRNNNPLNFNLLNI